MCIIFLCFVSMCMDSFFLANFDGDTHTCRLPPIDKVSAFWNYLESLFEDLMCCENFYTSQPLEGGCTKCANKGPTRRGKLCVIFIQTFMMNYNIFLLLTENIT